MPSSLLGSPSNPGFTVTVRLTTPDGEPHTIRTATSLPRNAWTESLVRGLVQRLNASPGVSVQQVLVHHSLGVEL